ncbi:MAG: ABC transporter ATP-binding protein [Tissierellia bacterium]|nr:ABC transporter ATP-binding protein [Tissierellia bacterium]
MNSCRSNPKLEIRNISKSFDGELILNKVHLCLYPGEIISLLGVSGSGKSTIFNIISGLLKPDDGKVLFNGEDITGMKGKVSYMLQKDLLLQHLPIVDNVALPLFLKGMPKKEARQQAIKHFEKFGLKNMESSYPHELSGGMAQRAAFLRTYLFSKEVALLDEPFSALDAITKSHIHSWYLDIMNEIKLSTIFVTHDIDEAIKLSHRIYILSSHPGEIVEEIPVNRQVMEDEEYFLTKEYRMIKQKILQVLA